MLTQDDALLQDFLTESAERLARLEELLLEAEQAQPQSGAELFRCAFREFHTLKGNAGFLGYAATAALCHAAEATLNALREERFAWCAKTASLLLAVVDAVRRQLDEALLTADETTTALLASLAALSGRALPACSGLAAAAMETDSTPPPAAPVCATPPAPSPHQDTNVYRVCALQSLRSAHSQEVWLATQLAGIAAQVTGARSSPGFARAVWEALRGHAAWSALDRVCLALAVPSSNQLQVVDSCCGQRVPMNLMPAGYSCFVDPRGSLFQLRPGTVRIFGDSLAVVRAFQAERRPVQRSIAIVAAMGLRSGLCLPLAERGLVRGFLFFNSLEPNAFEGFEQECAPLLALLPVIALEALRVEATIYPVGDAFWGDTMQPAAVFQARGFQAALAQAWRESFGAQREFHVESSTPEPFLYLPHQVTRLLTVVLGALQGNRCLAAAKILVERAGDLVSLTMPHGLDFARVEDRKWLAHHEAALGEQSRRCAARLLVSPTEVRFEIPFEPAKSGCGETCYSILG